MPALPTARVATRPGVSGVAAKRRRIYQRHLLLFLATGLALVAADLRTSPGLQWAHYLLAPWFLIFLLHSAGLKSRGYSFFEMLIPPRGRPARETQTDPLDYELVRARQLRDGLANAVNALRPKNATLAEQALAAADELLGALEAALAQARNPEDNTDPLVARTDAAARDAVAALDQLHESLLRIEILELEADVPVEAVKRQAQALRALSR